MWNKQDGFVCDHCGLQAYDGTDNLFENGRTAMREQLWITCKFPYDDSWHNFCTGLCYDAYVSNNYVED